MKKTGVDIFTRSENKRYTYPSSKVDKISTAFFYKIKK
jgi:hypothetical protein